MTNSPTTPDLPAPDLPVCDLAPNAIAIIGMACRLPGAADPDAFWANLCAGVESITRFAPEELRDAASDADRASPHYVAARPILPDIDRFDAGFFGMYAAEAAMTDPQQRLFLECAQEALDSAGVDPTRTTASIGVVAGASMNTYFLHNVCADRATIERFTSGFQVTDYPMLVGGGDFIATRTAYKLDLRGPAWSVQTACSTGLVAVAQACQNLLLYQSDMMLAGAASISVPQARGYLHQPGGMVSADGHCRSFDAAASGTVFGSGVGVVLLKRLEDAIADGDPIHAIIRGVAVNNDGAAKAGFTAPSIDGQEAVVTAALAMADVPATSITYIECHGTGTPLGDPIEVAALTRVFGRAGVPVGGCAIGSVKTNIGHLDAAAGIAGLIKTVLALQHATLPASLHFQIPNPRLELPGSPFVVNATLRPWDASEPRRAGVSALGVGGTNAHVILQQAPALEHRAPTPVSAPQLLVLSARSPSALATMRTQLAAHLQADPLLPLANVAATLQTGRRQWAHRATLTACTTAEAAETLLRPLPEPPMPPAGAAPPIALMFPGQGAQYAGMGRGLYRASSVWREAFDRCAGVVADVLGQDLAALLYGPETGASALDITNTGIAQPALFAVEYATATLLTSLGVRPAAMIGHSLGEFVAACLAGTFTLTDALTLVARRGQWMAALPGGAMLSVRMAEAALASVLPEGCAIAAVNAPLLCVAAGPEPAIAALEQRLVSEGVAARRLHTSHAFHSPMVDPVVPLLEALAGTLTLRPPTIPFVSAVTGTWITDEQATDPGYWARHCRAPVRFADALATLCTDPGLALLEAGPGRSLATLARQNIGAQESATKGAARTRVIAGCLPDGAASATPRADPDSHADMVALLGAVGTLWSHGLPITWTGLPPGCGAGAVSNGTPAPWRVRLPSYPFERQRHWIEAPDLDRASLRAPATLHDASPVSAMPTPDPPLMNQVTGAPAPMPASMNMPLSMPIGAPDQQRAPRLRAGITALLERLSGETIAPNDAQTGFVELGFDSLFLGQFAQALGREYGLTVAFRDLLGNLGSIAALAEHADATLPPDTQAVEAAAAPAQTLPVPTLSETAVGTGVAALMAAQLQAMQTLFAQQLAALQGNAPAPAALAPISVPTVSLPTAAAQTVAPTAAATASISEAPEPKSRFAVYRPGTQATATLGPIQQRHVQALVAATLARTGTSRAATAQHRARLADPRAAAGFRAEWKDMVYPIHCARAAGSRIWDTDGNEYIDLLNGYGQTYLGHAPPAVVDAMIAQIRDGFAIGPQSPLAGEVADLICELTGNERATFCNTGSEAVMAAMRVARAVTGRDRVVMFGGAYHGQFDEVLVKGARGGAPRALPVAPGIPTGSVSNMVVLPYTPESLEWVRANAAECAAVIVEPVQSRHPAWQPQAMLAELRAITEAAGAALVFDEVVTGFRMHPGGMQHVFGIRADLATYGKVLGGGMPIGVLAGTRRFMDALDGGHWEYGDDSYPEVAPTFFAGTFVRHPVVLAAARATLLLLKQQGPALQETLNDRTAALVGRLAAVFAERGLTPGLEHYGSLFYLTLGDGQRLGSLLWYHLRLRGIYLQEGFPCFMTIEHGPAECDSIVEAFADSLDAMLQDGMLERTATATEAFAVPPTEPQTEVWLAAQAGEAASCAFNEGLRLELTGPLDRAALTAALNAVIARHDALRCVFSPSGEHLLVQPHLSLALPEEPAGTTLETVLEHEATTPFDLVHGPLIRARLITEGPERHVLVLTAHHIVCDGWSFNVILDELAQLYAVAPASPPVLAPALPFSRHASRRAAEPEAEAVAWWVARFDPAPTPLELPTDRARPMRKTYRGATLTNMFDATLAATLRRAGGRQGCTLFATLLAGFTLLLGRLADTRDVVIATPAAGQSLVGDEVLVGHCVNLLPLRTTWDAATDGAALLARVQQVVLDAYDHQAVTLGTIVHALDDQAAANRPGIRRGAAGRVPLADVQFNLERLSPALELSGLRATTAPNPKRFVNFDLFLNIIESAEGLRLDLDYSTDLFDEATVSHWLKLYRTVLEALAAAPEQPVRLLALAAPSEPAPPIAGLPASVISMVAAAAAAHPHQTAIVGTDATLTYSQLQARTAALAARIAAAAPAGTSPGRVGVLLRRTSNLPLALLAVMRAGLAYIPLDPALPAARLRAILADAGAATLLTDAETESHLAADLPAAIRVLRIDQLQVALPDPAAAPGSDVADQLTPDQPAYVIYTSGSTGRPKGVEVPHGALANLLGSMARTPGCSPADRLLAVTTAGFDIAALELLLPLTTGGQVVIADDAQARDGTALVQLIQTHGITLLQATPSLWRILLEAGFVAPPGFTMLAGGEPLDRPLADRLLSGGGTLWNMYGPTETTIWSSCARIQADGRPITIGAPIADTGLQVLDTDGEPRPDGVAGELVITGAGLACGYVGAPALTAEAFPTLRLGGQRLRAYRTGDIARRTRAGGLQLLGRRDNQVKLRGYRIELGEIEAALAAQPGIAAAAVMLRAEIGGGQLVGYYTATAAADSAAPASRTLTTGLAALLPDYMVPALWVQLPTMPVTANGKIDRAALPAPDAQAPVASRVAPRSPAERQIAAIWQDVLSLDGVSVTDTLFALGADSIHLFRIAARLMRDGIGLTASDLLAHPTIAEQAVLAADRVTPPLASTGRSLTDFVRARRATLPA